jgi:hypothetical protein
MAAKTQEQKDHEAKAAADQKQAEADAKQTEDREAQQEAASKVADENAEKLATTSAVADAASKVHQARRTQDLAERQANISVGNDPETGKPVDDGPFAGQLHASDNFVITTADVVGREVVEIRPAGWVGPGFEVGADRLGELKTLIGKVKVPKK